MHSRLIFVLACWLFQLISIKNYAQEFTLYCIGDAGEDTVPGPALRMLDSLLQNETKECGVIFLGDNIYPKGLEKATSAKRELSEKRLTTQLQTVSGLNVQFYMVPGNHDWRASRWDGLRQLKEEEHFVHHYFSINGSIVNNPSSCFLPVDGLPGPSTAILNTSLRLIAYDPQWWLQQQLFHKVATKDGLTKKEMSAKFFRDLQQILDTAAKNNETVIIAGHHPLMTVGNHARFDQPLYFITTYIPPFQLFRLIGLNRLFRQDMQSHVYHKLADSMIQIITQTPQLVYVNGHDHNLQFFSDSQRHFFITSGAGSKTSAFDPKVKGSPLWKNDQSTGFFKLVFDETGLKETIAFTANDHQAIPVWKR